MSQKNIMKDFILPNEIKYEKNTYSNYYGKFIMYPFDKGVGITIANSLRRVLLSSIPGYAITSIKIEGINHEFEPIKGVKEDLTDIILSLKKVNVLLNDGSEKKVIHLNKKGKCEFLAKDIAVDPTIEILNPDLKIATLNDEADLSIDIQIEYGKGYRSAENAIDSNSVISVIPIDAIFSPVVRVNYEIEDFRVGEKTDCEKVILEVWTKGVITPLDAVNKASEILRKYFSIFSDFQPEIEPEGKYQTGGKDLKGDIYSKPIEELELSIRPLNCLKSANIKTIGDLVQCDIDTLINIKNFGKKSLNEIIEKLKIYNLTLKESKTKSDILEKKIVEDIEEGE